MANEWKTTTKYLVGVGIILFGLFVVFLSQPILPSLILGALIAFLVRPLIVFLMSRLRLPRGLAVFITYLFAVLFILILPLILIPSFLAVVEFFLELDYQILVTNIFDWARANLEVLRQSGLQVLGIAVNLDGIVSPLLRSLEGFSPVLTPDLPSLSRLLDSLLSAMTITYNLATDIIGVFISVFFMILASVYFSLDGERFYESFLRSLPESPRSEIFELTIRLKGIWNSFFRGQITLMVLIGFVVWVGGTILGLPGAFALGVIAGFLEIMPNLGPVLATIPAVIVALIQGSQVLAVTNLVFALIVIVFYVLVQLIENYFVVPRVLGDAVKLHPLVVISGVLIGAATWGILGALLAAPVIASAREIIKYLYAKILQPESDWAGNAEPSDTQLTPKKRMQLGERFARVLGRFSLRSEKTTYSKKSTPVAADLEDEAIRDQAGKN
jgi:predicted PurR-regulated permease PerM